MADVLAEYLPDKWLQTVATGVDPFNCVIALYLVVTKVMGNEKALVESYNERLLRNDQGMPGGARQTAEKGPVGASPSQEPGDYPETPLPVDMTPEYAMAEASGAEGNS